jgi:hypothetical protein
LFRKSCEPGEILNSFTTKSAYINLGRESSQSGGGPPHSKTCRCFAGVRVVRERLGLRQPSGAFYPDFILVKVSGLVLDASEESACMNEMRTKLLAAVCGLALAAAGCAGSAHDQTTADASSKDRIEAQYPRPVSQVYQAALDVIRADGAVVDQTVLNGQTNTVNSIGRKIEGKVGESTVWIQVQQLDSQTTSVIVQTRAGKGGSDMDLAARIDKEIDLKLRR